MNEIAALTLSHLSPILLPRHLQLKGAPSEDAVSYDEATTFKRSYSHILKNNMAGSLNSTTENLHHEDNPLRDAGADERQDDHKGRVLPFTSLC